MRKLLGLLIVLSLFLVFPNSVYANAPIQSNSQYTTPSGQVAANGTATETIVVHLRDSSNSPVVGDIISLSSSNDTTAVFNNTQTTDANGDATFTVKTTTPGELKITLTDSTNSVTFTDWLTLSFYDNSKGCINVPAAPVLTSVVSNTNNKATLTWTNSADPVNNYLVSFGIETGKYIYGDPNVGAQGTTSYTAGSLTSNKKYYFVVSATNNCGRSNFSNEMSTVVNPVTVTPKPTTNPTASPSVSTLTTPIPSLAPVVTYVTPETPQPTQKSVATVSSDDTKTRIRNIGLGIMGVGILLIGVVFVIQKIKKDNSIPLMGNSNIPLQQPEQLDPPVIENRPPQPFSF